MVPNGEHLGHFGVDGGCSVGRVFTKLMQPPPSQDTSRGIRSSSSHEHDKHFQRVQPSIPTMGLSGPDHSNLNGFWYLGHIPILQTKRFLVPRTYLATLI